MVEPSPRAFIKLQERHGANPRLTLIHAAIGIDSRIVPFWDESSIGGYSTTEETNRKKWEHLAGFKTPFYVSTLALYQLVTAFQGPFDFLSLDTEGTSTDLFLAYPFEISRPKVVCVEHDGRISDCLSQAGRYGYREVARNPENLVLIAK